MQPAADAPPADLAPTLARPRGAWQSRTPGPAQRRGELQRVRDARERRLPEMAAAIAADVGHRPRHASPVADGMAVPPGLDQPGRQVRGWMRPRRARTARRVR